MNVQLERSIVGVGYRDQIVDVPAAEAHKLIDNGHATEVERADAKEAEAEGHPLDEDGNELAGRGGEGAPRARVRKPKSE